MKKTWETSLLVLSAALLCFPVFADVTVKGTEAAKTNAWQASHGGGNLTISPKVTEDSVLNLVAPGSGFVQTFKGDGKKLEAVGFYFRTTSTPAQGKSFTISLIDYGTTGPINKSADQMNAVKTVVFSDSFRWNSGGTGRQYYFDFSGASNVVLDSTHFYGIMIQFPDATGSNGLDRSKDDAYADGRLGIGTIGAFGLNYAGGDRDANFAVYTEGGATPSAQAAPATPRYRGNASVPSPRGDANSMAAHEQLVAKAKAGGIDLYFLGDSITRRWGTSDPQWSKNLENWKQNFYGWNAGNFGWGADSIQNILWRIQNGELDGVNPKVIVILAGTNNVGNKPGGDEKVADIVKGIRALVDTSRQKAPGAKIIVTGITPRNDGPAITEEIRKINDQIARFADGQTIFYLNINDKLSNPDGTPKEGMTIDGLHLSVTGYQVWADALKPLLTQLLGPPAATDHAPPPTGDPSAAKSAPGS